MNRNPYAPSRASLTSSDSSVGDSERVWRDGKWLVMDVDATLPHRCVKCNEPAAEPLKRVTLYWHHPAYYVLVLLWVVVYVIVASIVRKTLKLEVGLCGEHKRKRRNAIAIGVVGMFGVIPLAILAGMYAQQEGEAMLAAIVAFIGFVMFLLIGTRIVYAREIDSRIARLGGAGERFLESLPPYRG